MAASVTLVYDSSKGSASYWWEGSTVVVKAKALAVNNYVLSRISVQCDQGNDVDEDYDSETEEVIFRSSGHTQCRTMTIRVVFVKEGTGTATLVVYAETVGGHGTLTPAMQTFTVANADGVTQKSVVITLTTTPDRGYKLEKLVNEDGKVISTSSSSTHRITYRYYPDAGDEDYKIYRAYFTPRTYKYSLVVDYRVTDDDVPVASGGTNRKSAGMQSSTVSDDAAVRRKLYYRSGSSYKLYDHDGNQVQTGSNYPFAYVEVTPVLVRPDTVLTGTLSIPEEGASLWELLDLRLAGWYVESRNGAESGNIVAAFPAVGNSVSIDLGQIDGLDFFSGSAENVKFRVHAVIVSSSEVSAILFSCVPPASGHLSVRSASGLQVYRGRGSVIGFMEVGSTVSLNVESIEGMGDGWFIHGWSVPLSGAWPGSYVASKTMIVPDADVSVVVYFCTHRLLHGSGGDLLHGGSRQLLCDCNVPPGTTVYD